MVWGVGDRTPPGAVQTKRPRSCCSNHRARGSASQPGPTRTPASPRTSTVTCASMVISSVTEVRPWNAFHVTMAARSTKRRRLAQPAAVLPSYVQRVNFKLRHYRRPTIHVFRAPARRGRVLDIFRNVMLETLSEPAIAVEIKDQLMRRRIRTVWDGGERQPGWPAARRRCAARAGARDGAAVDRRGEEGMEAETANRCGGATRCGEPD